MTEDIRTDEPHAADTESGTADIGEDRLGVVNTEFGQTGSAIPEAELERLTHDIRMALKSIYDPEIPADIYELGLIYKVDVDDDRNVQIEMTLTAPGCPVAGEMPGWVQNAVSAVAGINQVTVDMVFDPPWTADRMSDEARLMLDFYY
ncbi:MAG: SUF system Fe-S cluster assembly protein [Hyphomicrobiales bacterium]|nr:MAG: SUF system Fe-S cluster assembly protein [Hyphomicrobiales bacterium]